MLASARNRQVPQNEFSDLEDDDEVDGDEIASALPKRGRGIRGGRGSRGGRGAKTNATQSKTTTRGRGRGRGRGAKSQVDTTQRTVAGCKSVNISFLYKQKKLV